MTQYVICRILGNELPPRDLPGSRLAVFDYIFEREYRPEDTARIWVINRILDPEMLRRIKDKLKAANEKYIELGIDWDAYARAWTRKDKINALIGLNNARNEAFLAGAKQAESVFVLDGDCFFDEQTWQRATAEIDKDQLDHPQRKYYALPSARVFIENAPGFDLENVELEEPMLLIRSDATKLFDEKAAYATDSKVSLLFDLGLRRNGKQWYALHSEGPCAVVGSVLHLNTGIPESETDPWVRYMLRRMSLNSLFYKADALTAKSIMNYSASRAVAFKCRCLAFNFLEHTRFQLYRQWFQVKLVLRRLLVGTR